VNEAIVAAIAARLGEMIALGERLKAAVEAGSPAAPFSVLRMAVDVDLAANALQSHVERLVPSAQPGPHPPRPGGGTLQKSTYNGTSWTDTNSSIMPFALLLDDGTPFTVAASGGPIIIGG
jgi:hypothetical protein